MLRCTFLISGVDGAISTKHGLNERKFWINVYLNNVQNDNSFKLCILIISY